MSQPKTVRVRIAVAVGDDGVWNSCGWGGPNDTQKDVELIGIALEPMESGIVNVHWVEADVPVPASVVVEGNVSAEEVGE